MSIPFKTTLYVSKVEQPSGKKFLSLSASTSRKDTQNDGKYLYSNWYCKVLGEGFQSADELLRAYANGEKNDKGYLQKKFAIFVEGTLTNEPYTLADGETVYKNPQVAIFKWEWPNDGEKETKQTPASSKKSPKKTEPEDEEWMNE